MAQTLEAVFVHGNEVDHVDYTPSGADIANGEVINVAGGGGVCTTPEGIADGVMGSLAITGTFRFLKDGTSGPVIAEGALVGWDATANLAVAAADGDFVIGVCTKAAGTNEDGVQVRLIPGIDPLYQAAVAA